MAGESLERLNKSAIDRAKYSGDGISRCVLWDHETNGLGLRIYPSQKKSFVLSYYHFGRKRLLVLGSYGTITLHQARDIARDHLFKISRGEDPLEIKKQDLRAETVEEFCEQYIQRHAMLKKKTWKKDESRNRRWVFPAWGSRKLKSITGQDVALLHAKVGAHAPIEANRLQQQLSKMFNLAKSWGLFDRTLPNPASGIDKFRETKRDRWLNQEELPRLRDAIEEEASPYIRGLFYLYLLTGVRKAELLNSKWDDIDFTRKELRLPETKSGRSHRVPLSAPAMRILRKLPRHLGNPYVFPGINPGKPLVNIEKAWSRVRSRAGIKDIRLHDLRRTVASLMAQDGISVLLLSKLLNHQSVKTTEIYARLPDEAVRTALESHGKSFMNLIGEPKQTKGVIGIE